MEWLTQFFDKVFSVIPRLWMVDPDESGVRITLGTRVKSLMPGWYIYWPLVQTCEKIKVKTQPVDLRPQSIWTIDGHEVMVSGWIKYRVEAAQKAILEVFNYDANIQTLALGIIFDFVSKKNLDDLKQNMGPLKEEILRGVREASRGWGLKIETVGLTDIGVVKNIRLLMNEPMFGIKG